MSTSIIGIRIVIVVVHLSPALLLAPLSHRLVADTITFRMPALNISDELINEGMDIVAESLVELVK